MSIHLRSVDEIDPDERRDSDPVLTHPHALPDFEGAHVEFARFRIAAVADLEAPEDEPVQIDDVVRIFIEGRVTRIDHVVDEKSGKLKRVQTIKAVEAMKLPWDFDVRELDD